MGVDKAVFVCYNKLSNKTEKGYTKMVSNKDVILGLEVCTEKEENETGRDCDECPYSYEGKCVIELLKGALALAKQQQDEIEFWKDSERKLRETQREYLLYREKNKETKNN